MAGPNDGISRGSNDDWRDGTTVLSKSLLIKYRVVAQPTFALVLMHLRGLLRGGVYAVRIEADGSVRGVDVDEG